jgi:hypothetical protein
MLSAQSMCAQQECRIRAHSESVSLHGYSGGNESHTGGCERVWCCVINAHEHTSARFRMQSYVMVCKERVHVCADEQSRVKTDLGVALAFFGSRMCCESMWNWRLEKKRMRAMYMDRMHVCVCMQYEESRKIWIESGGGREWE